MNTGTYVFKGLNNNKFYKRKKIKNFFTLDDNQKINKIISIVCERYGVQFHWLTTKSRQRDFCVPRQIIMYLAYRTTKLNLSNIGILFNRDHATVLHANKIVNNLIDTDKYFSEVIRGLKVRL